MGEFKHEIFLKVNPANHTAQPTLSVISPSLIPEHSAFSKELRFFYTHGVNLAKLDSRVHVVNEDRLFEKSASSGSINAFLEVFLNRPGNWTAYQGLSVPKAKLEKKGFYIAKFNLKADDPKILLYSPGSDNVHIEECSLNDIKAVGGIVTIDSNRPTEISSKLETSLSLIERQSANRYKRIKNQPTNTAIFASDYVEEKRGYDMALVLTGYLER